MRRLLCCAALVLALCGCTVDPVHNPVNERLEKVGDVVGTRKVAIACQGADIATTLWAIHLGAVELNPLGLTAVITIKLGMMAYMKWGTTDEAWEQSSKLARVVVSAAGCIPAASNLVVIRQLK